MKIKSLKAREVIDSRGKPTIEAELNGAGAIAPSGASRGKYEAIELRDGGRRYSGNGVKRAVDNVNKIIAPKIVGKDLDQKRLDCILCDLAGNNKWKLGGNATTAVSIAFCRASGDVHDTVAQLSASKPSIPIPFMNVINGGAHAGNSLAIQEFMIVPVKAKTFSEGLQAGCEVYAQLKKVIVEKHGKTAANVGDEGGFAPPLKYTKDALAILWEAVEEAGYAGTVKISMDAAASQFFEAGKYVIDDKRLSPQQMVDYYIDLGRTYPIFSVEDPFNEEDFSTFSMLKAKAKFRIVADDLTVTNPERIRKAAASKSADTLLVKINQIGTITETIDAINLARKNGWEIIVSHRSGDTEDSFIADFAAGTGAMGLKAGAPCRSERTAKYNQLLRLEELLPFAGKIRKL